MSKICNIYNIKMITSAYARVCIIIHLHFHINTYNVYMNSVKDVNVKEMM